MNSKKEFEKILINLIISTNGKMRFFPCSHREAKFIYLDIKVNLFSEINLYILSVTSIF